MDWKKQHNTDIHMISKIAGVSWVGSYPKLPDVVAEVEALAEGYSARHQPLAYLAHAITLSPELTAEPAYYEHLAEALDTQGVSSFRPINFFNAKGHPCEVDPKLLVVADLLIIRECDILVLDLTTGLSFGATVETTFAKLVNVPVAVVHRKDQRVSSWAKGLANYMIPIDDSIVASAHVAQEVARILQT